MEKERVSLAGAARAPVQGDAQDGGMHAAGLGLHGAAAAAHPFAGDKHMHVNTRRVKMRTCSPDAETCSPQHTEGQPDMTGKPQSPSVTANHDAVSKN